MKPQEGRVQSFDTLTGEGVIELENDETIPFTRDAVLLRQWDDLAKQPRVSTPPLAHFLQRASRCLLTHAADA